MGEAASPAMRRCGDLYVGAGHSRSFVFSEYRLTRRAKHLHTDIIGKVDRPAREIAAGFLFAEIHQSDGGARFRRPHSPHRACLSAASRAAVRTPFTFHIGRCARTHWPGRRVVSAACGPLTRIGFVPETIASPPRSAAHSLSRGERMTAYLISLALLGLVAIVVAEILS